MKKLYIIAGPNGAGKTTASYTILPEIFHCSEFVNADEIAKGLSPFNPENVKIEAGRLMLERIKHLLKKGESFAFETTLSTKSYSSFIREAKSLDYEVILLFLSLSSPELAVKRVQIRVSEGGHNIPVNIIKRRFDKGLKNFFNMFLPIVDSWMFIDNSGEHFEIIAQGVTNETEVKNRQRWDNLKRKYYGN